MNAFLHGVLVRVRPVVWRFLSLLLGDFTWQPPAWLRALGSWAWVHRRAVAVAALVLLSAAIGGWRWRVWWQHRPKPHLVTVTVDPIPVTTLRKERLYPSSLRLHFAESAAALALIGQPLDETLVRLEPSWPGKWFWVGDRTLAFSPATDWPAVQKFRIVIDRAALSNHVRLERYDFEATTPPFAAQIQQVEFYQDPTNPAVKQVTATLYFTHSVDRAEVARHMSLAMLGDSPVIPPKDAAMPFTLTDGPHQRQYYFRTSSLNLPEKEDFMKLILTQKGLHTLQGGAELSASQETKVRIPDIGSLFHITGVKTHIVRNKIGDPEQFVMIGTSSAARSEDIAKTLQIRRLPKSNPHRTEASKDDESTPHPQRYRRHRDENDDDEDEANSIPPADRDGRYHISQKDDIDDSEEDAAAADDADKYDEWAPDEIDADALALSTPLTPTLVPAAEENSTVHTFKINTPLPGQLCVTVGAGTPALGGFTLRDEYKAVVPAPLPDKEIALEGEGGVLALSGERKLSVKSRGVAAIRYEIARVPAAQINHLASQTEGNFESPEFLSRQFNEQDIARSTIETQPINLRNPVEANYSTFDFSAHLLPKDDTREGLFFLTATAWDAKKGKYIAGVESHRFILVTDLGLLVKANADGTRDVFVQSIGTQEPAAGVAVEILARNGVILTHTETDAQGRATLPSLGKNPRDSRQAVAITVRKGDDVAFMPFNRADRELNFSRFDTDGITQKTGQELDAFVFTERGVYRPGDEMHIGVIVKQRDWAGRLEGLPLEAEVRDARDASAQVSKLVLPASGFVDFTCPTAYESPTGEYNISVYLLREGKRSTLLGSATAFVKEFLPDRLKIETKLTKASPHGWVSTDELNGAVRLQNLYGTPASERLIKAHLRLDPRRFRFKEWADYTFFDHLADERHDHWDGETVDLGDEKTDASGNVAYDFDLARFSNMTCHLTFAAEGFEAEGGRSVEDQAGLIVSPLPHVVGYKADGTLDFITKAGGGRAVEFIAIDPALNRIGLEKLTLVITEQAYVSVLTKQDNGNYVYESILHEKPVLEQPAAIAAGGWKYALPCDNPGTFKLEIHDEHDVVLSRLTYTVAGDGAVSRSLEKNAELNIKLSRPEFRAGENIDIAITAPYAGSGLITIERERVYAHRWFKTTGTSSIQTITIPADFDGTGYVNVSFVRALDSKEIFMSPLSYAVAPFTANKEARRLNIDLRAAERSRPGEPLAIHYQTDRPAKIALFAVDSGILQVTKYKTPEPLDYAFRKVALGVRTTQIVDLLLPEFGLLRNASSVGGDGDAPTLNPFRRVTEKPVVYWSGVVDADNTDRTVTYQVPDYFSGTLTIMAVAVSPDALGSAHRNTLIRAPFTLTAGVPTLAAPGDQFEVGLTVANQLPGSGERAAITVRAEGDEALEILRAPNAPLIVPEGHEFTTTFLVRAKEHLGSARLGFRASLGGEASGTHATLSIRPAAPFITLVRGGSFQDDSLDVTITRSMYPDYRKLQATVSALPLGLARGLDAYLKKYPFGCSEQLASGAFARIALADQADFGLTRAEVVEQLNKTFELLRRRQNDQGRFGYWTMETRPVDIDFVTAYVTHFLSEAKAAGYAVPPECLKNGLGYLQKMVTLTPLSLSDARRQAYALYVLTREGVVTTNYLLNLRDTLDKQYHDRWQHDLTGPYLAATLMLLKKEDEAQKLIQAFQPGKHDAFEWEDFYQPLCADSQYLMLITRHFPERLKALTAEEFKAILRPIGEGEFSTLSAAYAVLALKGYSQFVAHNPAKLSIGTVSGGDGAKKSGGQETLLATEGGDLLRQALFPGGSQAVRFHRQGGGAPGGMGAFYQVVEGGFDRNPPKAVITKGMEVYRELLDEDWKPVTKVKMGDRVTVRIRARSLKGRAITNAAILDLLPGGFEVVGGSLQPGAGTVPGMDYVEVREDRAVFFGTIDTRVQEIVYQIKPVNRGEFTVPPVFAESMYDRNLRACGLGGRITVLEATK